MPKVNLVAPCSFGIEGILAAELKRMDADDVVAQNGKVYFSGDKNMIARANINSRYAERIQVLVGTFKAKSFEELFQGTKDLPWEKWIGELDKFPVKGWSLDSKLFSVPDCQSIVKKAIVEKLKEEYKLDWFDETGSLYQIQFTIHKDEVNLLIDTTGDGLHKRGYRAISGGEAPIKETLAAAIVDLSRARIARHVYDPCCGSGTLLIEAALSARGIASGINKIFASMSWEQLPKEIWALEKEAAREKVEAFKDREFAALGSDIDEKAILLTMDNAVRAGVGSDFKTYKADLKDFELRTETGVVLCNPPYGERLLDVKEAENIYKTMGQVFKRQKGWSYFIISPHEDFEDIFGRKADKRRKLYNGTLECQLYMYFK